MANLLVNGDFETGSLTPWVGFNASISTTDPIGIYCAELIPPVNDIATIAQTVTLVPGSTYTFRVWLNTIVKESFVTVYENANPLSFTFSVVNGFWQEYVFGFTASLATTTITIEAINNLSILDDGLLVDDVSLTLNEICFRGDSLVKVKTREGIEDVMLARDVRAGEHLVYSTQRQEYVELLHNLVTGRTSRFCLVKKNSLGVDQPNSDFYVTSGHRILYRGEELKARDLPGAIRVKVPAENLYSFVTVERQPVSINGLEVMAYGGQEWEEYQKVRGLIWLENGEKNV